MTLQKSVPVVRVSYDDIPKWLLLYQLYQCRYLSHLVNLSHHIQYHLYHYLSYYYLSVGSYIYIYIYIYTILPNPHLVNLSHDKPILYHPIIISDGYYRDPLNGHCRFKAISCREIPLHSPCIDLVYGTSNKFVPVTWPQKCIPAADITLVIEVMIPFQDPWCCCIWCAMDPINIPQSCYHIHQHHGSFGCIYI